MQELLQERFEGIFEDNLIKDIADAGQVRRIPKDFPMMSVGEPLTHMPLVLDGAIRVMSEEGESEYLLYYLETGDSCAMTMSCCLGGKRSHVNAVTEQDTTVVMVPVAKMEEWLIKYRSWRAFVFESYDNRLTEMRKAVDALAFHNLEERLYLYLRDKAMVLGGAEIEITHSQIANDLNTSRVVVSRLMKKLSGSQKIETGRNRVIISEFLPK